MRVCYLVALYLMFHFIYFSVVYLHCVLLCIMPCRRERVGKPALPSTPSSGRRVFDPSEWDGFRSAVELCVNDIMDGPNAHHNDGS